MTEMVMITNWVDWQIYRAYNAKKVAKREIGGHALHLATYIARKRKLK